MTRMVVDDAGAAAPTTPRRALALDEPQPVGVPGPLSRWGHCAWNDARSGSVCVWGGFNADPTEVLKRSSEGARAWLPTATTCYHLRRSPTRKLSHPWQPWQTSELVRVTTFAPLLPTFRWDLRRLTRFKCRRRRRAFLRILFVVRRVMDPTVPCPARAHARKPGEALISTRHTSDATFRLDT